MIIGGELFTALRRLRWYKRTYSEDEPLMLWVDTLCINQNNMGERKKYVKRMGPCHHEPLIFKQYGSHAAGGSEVDFMFEQDSARHAVRGKHVDTIKVVETLQRTQRNAIIDQPLVV